MSGITLLGLGPGDPLLVTREAWNVLESCGEIYVRTSLHPTVAGFPPNLRVNSFDSFYDDCESFNDVYRCIVDVILNLGQRTQGVVYAVPGHPFIAEATTFELVDRAQELGIPVKVIEGLSFLEPVISALGLDPFPHLEVIDALELGAIHHPPFPPSAHAIIAQIHSKLVASEVKLTLMALYPDQHPVIFVHSAGTKNLLVEHLPLSDIDRNAHIGLTSSLYVPSISENSSFESLQNLIAHLRAPDGCPWDREQTHQSLRPHLLEEAYEVLSALDSENPQKMKEEFGDLLLQIVLHAQIAREQGEFSMVDIIQGLHDKLVRRHPHVFGNVEIKDKEGVLSNWERLKSIEREHNNDLVNGLLEGVSSELPALLQAQSYQKRAARVGFDWSDKKGVLQKITEEIDELDKASDQDARISEIGDLLFSLVNLARWYDIDAESALRGANHRFRQRFAYIEASARRLGVNLSDLTLNEMDALWDEAKSEDDVETSEG
ncbi:MAG: nucleoside triphosphate pyrophosphohydrolase [Anaerolineales bacterium]|nr:nucleoside triphosphate pyrophosphohydrolase [Anaerolineales bacterium]